MLGIYFFLKFVMFFSIVKALVKFDTLGRHALALGVLYTALVAFISYIFILTTRPEAFSAHWIMWVNARTGLSPWLIWLGATFLLSTLYFKLLSRFDEGMAFWVLLLLGVGLAFF
jgi:predicted AlkP superfamily pyrophosphatase or phosphodiesterase